MAGITALMGPKAHASREAASLTQAPASIRQAKPQAPSPKPQAPGHPRARLGASPGRPSQLHGALLFPLIPLIPLRRERRGDRRV